MNKRIEELLASIKVLEKELRHEIQRICIDTYVIRDRTVRFKDEIKARHKEQAMRLFDYLRHVKLKHVPSAPLIWLCVFPALFMGLIVSLFQAICFYLYGIPKVRRRDYFIIDRQYLGYGTEIATRTEQYWCPIKHASQLKVEHSRYKRFLEYGDSEQFRASAGSVRSDFRDLDDEHKP